MICCILLFAQKIVPGTAQLFQPIIMKHDMDILLLVCGFRGASLR